MEEAEGEVGEEPVRRRQITEAAPRAATMRPQRLHVAAQRATSAASENTREKMDPKSRSSGRMAKGSSAPARRAFRFGTSLSGGSGTATLW